MVVHSNSQEDSLMDRGQAAPERFNIMVAGESGLGKTTCMHTILNELRGNGDAVLREVVEKTLRIVEIGKRLIRKDTLPAYCHIFDTPGYGDKIDNQESFDMIKDDLVARHREYDDNERKLGISLSEAERKSKDRRIHCCLYFLAPHRLKEIDIKFMRFLAEYVVVVPVVAKSDTMTCKERNKYLKEVKSAVRMLEKELQDKLAQAGVANDSRFRVTYNFGDKKERYTSTSDIMPRIPIFDMESSNVTSSASVEEEKEVEESFLKKFHNYDGGGDSDDDENEELLVNDLSVSFGHGIADALSGSSDLNIGGADDLSRSDESMLMPMFNSKGELDEPLIRYRNIFAISADPQKVRSYAWGDCLVDNKNHSDFPILSRLLFEPRAIQGMIDQTRLRTKLLVSRREQPSTGGSKQKALLTGGFLLMLTLLYFRYALKSCNPICYSNEVFASHKKTEAELVEALELFRNCTNENKAYNQELTVMKAKLLEDESHFNETLKSCKADIDLHSGSNNDKMERILFLEQSNSDLEQRLTDSYKLYADSSILFNTVPQCYSTNTLIMYDGKTYDYQDLDDGKESACKVTKPYKLRRGAVSDEAFGEDSCSDDTKQGGAGFCNNKDAMHYEEQFCLMCMNSSKIRMVAKSTAPTAPNTREGTPEKGSSRSRIMWIHVLLLLIVFILENYLDLRQLKNYQDATSMPSFLENILSHDQFQENIFYYTRILEVGRLERAVTILFQIVFFALRGWLASIWDNSLSFCLTMGLISSSSFSLWSNVVVSIVFVVIYTLLKWFLSCPFFLYRKLFVDSKFNVPTHPLHILFLKEKLNGLVMSSSIVYPCLFMIASSAMQSFGPNIMLVCVWLLFFVCYEGGKVLLNKEMLPRMSERSLGERDSLRAQIMELASEESFPLAKIFVSDLPFPFSKTFFFDPTQQNETLFIPKSLIEELNDAELVAMVYHEIASWKLGNQSIFSQKNLPTQMYYVLQLILCAMIQTSQALPSAFGFRFEANDTVPVCVAIVLFTLLWHPLNFVMTFLVHMHARNNKLEADRNVKNSDRKNPLAEALLKTSLIENLDRLVPDSLYSLYHFSEPSVVERLSVLKEGTDFSRE